MPNTDVVHNPIMLVVVLAVISLLPFVLIAVTSFVKISVILSILKNALGAGQVPSGAVIAVLAFALSLHIMQPVGAKIVERLNCELKVFDSKTFLQSATQIQGGDKVTQSNLTFSDIYSIVNSVSEPLTCFLRQHSGMRERLFFVSVGQESEKDISELTKGELLDNNADNKCSPIIAETWGSLVPAFLITELNEAFAVGFRILLPFLVLDLVVANVLMVLGMMMVSPVTISFPFKILLFVMCDGWFLLCQSIITAYQI